VWVTSDFGQAVSRINPATGAVAKLVHVAGRPAGITATGAGWFVAVRLPAPPSTADTFLR
jgi:streptogramin lyase